MSDAPGPARRWLWIVLAALAAWQVYDWLVPDATSFKLVVADGFELERIDARGDVAVLPIAAGAAVDRIDDRSGTRKLLTRVESNLAVLGGGQALAKDLPDISDFLVVNGDLFVIWSDRLALVEAADKVTTLVRLPVTGMRFGEVLLSNDGVRERPKELPTSFLIYGGTGPYFVYRVMADRSHAKVVESQKPIRAAAGCETEVYFVADDTVYAARRGAAPVVLLQAREPEIDAVISLAPARTQRWGPGERAPFAGCDIFAATAHAVYFLSRGLATMAVTGAGGKLRGNLLFDENRKLLLEIRAPRRT